jgi:serine/threonine-protein phosphatase 6 regulatory subunit 3
MQKCKPDPHRTQPKIDTHNSAKPKGVRLGFMGHLTLMSEDVITALERFPPELRLVMIEYAPDPEWDQYVTGRYKETKRRDTRVLGGGKPVVVPGTTRNVTRWKIDEDDVPPETNGSADSQESKGEFRRAGGMHPARESSADFGPAPIQEEEDEEESTSVPHVRFWMSANGYIVDHCNRLYSSLVIWHRRCTLLIILGHRSQMTRMRKAAGCPSLPSA